MVMNERKGRQGPAKYEIKVRGRIEERWSDYFEGFEIACAAGTTTLVGAVRDQAALYGLLNRIRDLVKAFPAAWYGCVQSNLNQEGVFIIKRILRTVGVLSILAILISAGACATIEAYTPPITDAGGAAIPGSVNTIETVMLGGVAQTITIRGVDRTKPVLLHLHGGPGLPSSPWATWSGYYADLEANFVLVHWDQRGAGKSFSKDLSADDMHAADFVNDTLELTNLLRERFDQDKIFLWGHSWGSGLGFETLRVDSEPYYAFFASSVRPQWNRSQEMGYELLLRLVTEAEDADSMEALTALRPFNAGNREHLEVTSRIQSQYLVGNFHTEGLEEQFYDYAIKGSSPEYPRSTLRNTMAGIAFSMQTIAEEVLNCGYDHARDFPVSDIPVHFFTGRYDHVTPGELAYAYFEKLEAPAKSFTWFENSAHMINFDEPDDFNRAIIRIAQEALNP
jgi:pimeloyl-ACP methyl ester carboxylesterase